MKRTIAIVAGVLSVGVSAYLASQLFAQTAPYAPGAAPAAAPAPMCTSKIAVINLQKVIKNYIKFKNMQADLKKENDGYRAQMEAYEAKIKQLETQLNTPTTPQDQKDKIVRDIKDLKRQGQDKAEEFNTMLQKHGFDHIVITFKDVQEATAAFARSRGLELVMHYQDGEGAEMYMQQFLKARMTNNACQPIYMAPGLDITDQVTEMLNKRITAAGPGAPAAPGGVR